MKIIANNYDQNLLIHKIVVKLVHDDLNCMLVETGKMCVFFRIVFGEISMCKAVETFLQEYTWKKGKIIVQLSKNGNDEVLCVICLAPGH